jgi:excisionase family DNA binding protein
LDTASLGASEKDFWSPSVAPRFGDEDRPSIDQSHRLLTCKNVAELLQVSERTVRRLVERGELAEVRIGPTIQRFYPSDVEAFIAANRKLERAERPVLGLASKTGVRQRPGERLRYAERMRDMRP